MHQYNKISYIIFKAQWKIKLGAPFSKIMKNFKAVKEKQHPKSGAFQAGIPHNCIGLNSEASPARSCIHPAHGSLHLMSASFPTVRVGLDICIKFELGESTNITKYFRHMKG